MRILVTAGGTREPIDAVRYISNTSTGTTGAALADAWAHAGHNVILLRGTSAVAPKGPIECDVFSSTEDLAARLARHLAPGNIDLVVMAAAVADYRPVTTATGKLSSSPAELTLRLVRTPKLLPTLKSLAPNPVRVVGFKLTAGADLAARHAAVAAQFAAGGVDAVVQNDQDDVRAAGPAGQRFRLFSSAGNEPRLLTGTAELAAALVPVSV